MARARFIRPEFFTDEKIGELSFGARILFSGIWCQADLRGVFEHSPKLLRVQVFPFDEGVTSDQVSQWLSDLSERSMVAHFEVDGKIWGYVCNWSTYQPISGREQAIGTRRPAPPTQEHAQARHGHDLEHARAASPSPSPTPAPAPTSNTLAPAFSKVERERHFLEELGATTRRDGRCIMREWAAETKKLKPERIAEIFKEAVPGIQWPSQFRNWRAAKGNY